MNGVGGNLNLKAAFKARCNQSHPERVKMQINVRPMYPTVKSVHKSATLTSRVGGILMELKGAPSSHPAV
jgi:hypothetical protein